MWTLLPALAALAGCSEPTFYPVPVDVETGATDTGPPTGPTLPGDTGTPSTTDWTPGQPLPCSEPSATAPATLTVDNGTADALRLVWRDTACAEHVYADIPAGGSYDQGTFVGHAWALYTPAGAVADALVVRDPATTWTLP